MDKIDKFLKKISQKERIEISELVASIIHSNVDGLDCKKLKGYSNIFRIRKGGDKNYFSKD